MLKLILFYAFLVLFIRLSFYKNKKQSQKAKKLYRDFDKLLKIINELLNYNIYF
jgi:hypothetical protein